MAKTIRIGTRGSQLALIQTELVAAALKSADPNLETENIVIKTTGDANFAPIPLDTVGKSWFTREIDDALLNGKIDLAIHSLKDLPLAETEGLSLQVVLPRADPRDCLVASHKTTLLALPAQSVIGTDSARRRALLLSIRPDLVVKSIRGNVQTRLKKLASGDHDAIILAAAGIIRLDQSDIITEFLDPAAFIPASGQGALAAVTRTEDTNLIARLQALVDEATAITSLAERAFSARFGGGCQLPVAAHAELDAGTIKITGVIAEIDGPGILIDSASGHGSDWLQIAYALADKMRENCPFTLAYDAQ